MQQLEVEHAVWWVISRSLACLCQNVFEFGQGSRAGVEHKMKLLQMADVTLVMVEGRMHDLTDLQIPAVIVLPALAKDETKPHNFSTQK